MSAPVVGDDDGRCAEGDGFAGVGDGEDALWDDGEGGHGAVFGVVGPAACFEGRGGGHGPAFGADAGAVDGGVDGPDYGFGAGLFGGLEVDLVGRVVFVGIELPSSASPQ